MNILLAADGSDYTRRAALYLVSHLGWLAKRPKVKILTVHGALPQRAAEAAGGDAVHKYHEEECRKALAVAEKVFHEARVEFESTWKVGDVAQEICEFADANAIDVIVMGSHGHSALRTLALGSVADGVLRGSKVPVTIIR